MAFARKVLPQLVFRRRLWRLVLHSRRHPTQLHRLGDVKPPKFTSKLHSIHRGKAVGVHISSFLQFDLKVGSL